MPGPLHRLKVVDFSRVLAGPLCARTLADLGADIIKIEPPWPDVSRAAYPFRSGMSGYYAQLNACCRVRGCGPSAPDLEERDRA